MPELITGAQAPSNIALVKYMGKKETSLNLPENPSISLTLQALCSVTEIHISSAQTHSVQWVSEIPQLRPENLSTQHSWVVPRLSDSNKNRVIRHFERVRDALPEIFSPWGLICSPDRLKGAQCVLKTANTFPASSGIASSASSFASITLATAAAFSENLSVFQRVLENEKLFRRSLATLSRMGSGSSCRSFEGPWVRWEGEEAAVIPSDQMPKMAHFVVLLETSPKKVSSSEAHSRVRSSPLWEGRVERAKNRTQKLLLALDRGSIPELAQIAWTESWEMHSLFHTSAEPFSYWAPATIEALHWFAPRILQSHPPIITLDAGPNIHVIVEFSQKEKWRAILREKFVDFEILEDQEGRGASILKSEESHVAEI